jgi:cytochrome c oxidase subunit 1
MPIGIHHLFADPEVGSGFKYVHSVFTAMVVIPTLLTVFTICASVEIAARLRGGKGMVGWVRALPWQSPAMLGLTFSFVLLGFGGAGGLINMSYQLDSTIHNTQWVTGHFHLIFAGAVVIMYFIIAYDLWPHLTQRSLGYSALIRTQLWLWFIGTLIMTVPWHLAGLLGMPHRMAYFDYSNPSIAPEAWTVTAAVVGGALMVTSGALFVAILLRAHWSPRIALPTYRFSLPMHAPVAVPKALNGFAVWIVLMIALTAANYGFPIIQLMAAKTNVPAVYYFSR